MARRAALLAAAAWALAGVAAAGEGVILTVGVRGDSPPFAYRSTAKDAGAEPGPLYENGFSGYVVHVCDAVLSEMKGRHGDALTLEVREVDARDRFTLLEKVGGIDILCDPATIDASRLAAHHASLPIFLSGIAYAYPQVFPSSPYCGIVAGVVEATTAEANGVAEIVAAGEWKTYEDRVRAHLAPEQASGAPGGADCTGLPAVTPEPSHSGLAEKFCKGEIIFYVGDVEIIRRQLQERPDCAYSLSAGTFTDERYAIFSRSPIGALNAALILDFHATLARLILVPDSLLLEAYERHFAHYAPSRKLQAFYWSLFGGAPAR